MIVVGQIRQLDVDKQTGRLRGSHPAGDQAFSYNSQTSTVIKHAFVQDLTVVMEINDRGWCDYVRQVIPFEVNRE